MDRPLTMNEAAALRVSRAMVAGLPSGH
jgi:hypothetical protein